MYRAYAGRIATEVITQQVDYECCRWQLMFQSLLDRQLVQLGLRPWPLDTAVYDQLARQPAVGGLARLLIDRPSYTPLEQKRLYAFVEFLEPLLAEDVTLADMQRELDKPRGITAWVNEFADTPFDDNSVERAFFRHILQHTTAAQNQEPPIPLPDAHIQLVCNPEGTNGRIALYNYDLTTESWQEQYHQDNLPFWAYFQTISTAPNLILMIETPDPEATEAIYTLLENGAVLDSFTYEGTNNFYGWGGDPHGRYLLLGRWYDGPPEFRLLDVEACRAGDCLPEPVAGLMVWSPDGRHTLTTPAAELDQPTSTIWLGDAVGENRQLVGAGKQPFWIDAQTYGYVQTNGAAQEEWVTAVVGENSPRVLLSAERVLNSIPQEQRPTSIYMNPPFALTAGSDQLGMMAYASSDAEQFYYFFIITLNPEHTQVESLSLLYQDDRTAWVELSPDGRWLMTFADGEFGSTQVTLHNRENDIAYSPPPSSNLYGLSWSPDGNWTVHTGDGYLFLSAPDVQYEQIIFHDFGECTHAFWQE
ncbi:MAG: hypothetical protein HC804_01960 [Anaerolineae bacterium]|nr:hypothetical protein [Anaerolineae bacterium]